MTLKKRAGLILRLANGETVAAAARSERVSRSHVYKLLADPQAQRDMLAIRARYQRLTVGKMVRGSVKAVDKLVALLGAESEHVQLSAARYILTLTPEWIATADHEIRLTDLEAAQARRDAQNGHH